MCEESFQKIPKTRNSHLLIIGTFKGDENSMKSIRDFNFSNVEKDKTEKIVFIDVDFSSSRYSLQPKKL